MNAQFFSVEPRPAAARPATVEPRLRQLHRWVSMVFTLTVAANFVAMIWGAPPAAVTYAPLPPLLLLLLTGLYMLVRHYQRAGRSKREAAR